METSDEPVVEVAALVKTVGRFPALDGPGPKRPAGPQLPTPRSVATWTSLIGCLVAVASLVGLLDPGTYEEETRNWATQAKGQDLGNLLALGSLALSGYFYAKGSFRAALVWVGTVLYLVYAYVLYSLAVHFNQLFLVYVAVLGLSSYALLFSIHPLRSYAAGFPGPRVRRAAGYLLTAIGALFALMWLNEIIRATLAHEAPQSAVDAGLWVNPVHVIDLALVLPAFVLTGLMAARGRGPGAFFVAPWLVFCALMGTSIVATMVLMNAEGFEGTVPVAVALSLVVVASGSTAGRYLRGVTTSIGSQFDVDSHSH